MHKFGTKKISVIAAVSQNGVYSQDGRIPWRISEELQIFKERTIGHCVIMGRKTWDSLPATMRPMPGRENVILTTGQNIYAPGVRLASSLERAIRVVTSDSIFVIGGRALWFEAMDFADEAWITVVQTECRVDQSTKTAHSLVQLVPYWPNFALSEIAKYGGKESTHAFHIYHWVRR